MESDAADARLLWCDSGSPSLEQKWKLTLSVILELYLTSECQYHSRRCGVRCSGIISSFSGVKHVYVRFLK